MAKEVRIIDGKGDYTAGTGADTSDLGWFTNLIAEKACVFKDADLAVTERGAGADMSVDVAAGEGLVLNAAWSKNDVDDTRFWPIVNDATVNVTISANSSGNDRIDIIVAQIDTVTAPNDDGTNVITFDVVEGTPAGSPSAPATPSNAYKLAEVAVANGASSIVDANITDTRTQLNLALEDGRLIMGAATGNDAEAVYIDTSAYTADMTTGDPIVLIKDDDNHGRIKIDSFGSVGSVASTIEGIGATGTIASPGASADNQVLIQLQGGGYDNAGTPAESAGKATLKLRAAETWTTTNQATKMTLDLTQAGGSTTAQEVLEWRYGSGGNVTIEAQQGDLAIGPASNGQVLQILRFPTREHGSTTYTSTMMCRGWAYVTGLSGTAPGGFTITSPITFANTEYDIQVQAYGAKTTGVPANRNDINLAAISFSYANPTTTSTFFVGVESNIAFNASYYYVYSFIIMGPV